MQNVQSTKHFSDKFVHYAKHLCDFCVGDSINVLMFEQFCVESVRSGKQKTLNNNVFDDFYVLSLIQAFNEAVGDPAFALLTG